MRLVPGDPERLGGYWMAGRLGAGGQGVVYDAYDEHGRRFAVKVLHGGVSEQLAKEAKAARRAASFCTARVVEVVLDAERPYIVSEFVEGPNLREAVERDGPYTGDGLRRLAVALATALAAVHASGVVHRDLKPENVLLGPDGPRVIDFGVARTVDTSSTGFVGGTPTYMAPEVFTGARAGAPADVFAWGGVVLYAATGADPFQAESLGAVMHRVLTVDPDLDALDEPLRELVGRALSKAPDGRPAARDLLLGLLGSAEPEAGAELAAAIRPPSGLSGARPLGEVAEEVYAALTPQQQQAVPGILLRMLDGEGMRRIPRAEADDQDVLARLADAGLVVRRSIRVRPQDTETGRLVAVSDDQVAPASTALFHAWPRLRAWVADDRDGLAVHAELRAAALRWSAGRRRPGDLYTGGALATALGWAATTRRHLGLNGLEREFLDHSTALARRRSRIRGVALAGLAALLAVAVSASVLAVRQSRDLSDQLVHANARAVAARAESLRAADPKAAMRLSVAAWSLSPVFEARTAVQRSLAQPEVARFTDPEADTSATYQLGDDGRSLLKLSGDRVVSWDLSSGEPTRLRVTDGTAQSVSRDGRRAAVSQGDRVRMVDLASGQQLGSARPTGDLTMVEADGRLLSVVTRTKVELYPRVGEGMPFDVGDGGLDVSPDGRWAALCRTDGRVELWDLGERTLKTSLRVDPPVTEDAGAPPAAFSRDGATLALTGSDGVTLVDTATGRKDLLPSRAGSLHPVVFSHDGRFLAERLDDEDRLGLWRLADRTFAGAVPAQDVEDVAFSSDGVELRYLTRTASVVTLDISAAVSLPPDPDGRPADLSAAARLSPDGRVAATEHAGTIELTDREKGEQLGRIRGAGPLAFGGGGSLLAVAGAPVTIHEAATGKQVASLDVGVEHPVVQLSPDGRTLAVQRGQAVELWSVAERRRLRAAPGVVESGIDTELAFSPDGATLAAGPHLIETATGRLTRDPAGLGRRQLRAVSFSPDGRWLAYVFDGEGLLILKDLRTGGVRQLTVPAGSTLARFSPDGGVLAVGGGEAVELWQTADLRELGRAPVDDYAFDLAFSPDGRRLFALQPGGAVQETPVEPALMAAQVCARAGGPLSEAEWAELIPEAEYRRSC
jgi:WD40 repeat protein/predicted Ser/Thr protein kinase